MAYLPVGWNGYGIRQPAIFKTNTDMKKLLAIISAVLLLASCNTESECVITYRVYFNDTPTECIYKFKGGKGAGYILESYRGSNRLSVYPRTFPALAKTLISTTAPIEVVELKKPEV